MDLLPAADVASLSSTCTRLRAAATDAPYGPQLWRRLAAAALGPTAAHLHAAAVPGGGDAAYWAAVVAGATTLASVHWCRRSARALRAGVVDADAGAGDAAAWPPGAAGGGAPAAAAGPARPATVRRSLARSGHTATDDAAGRVIVTGGVRRDGGTAGELDVVVVDAAACSVAAPRAVLGAAPRARFRHAAVLLADAGDCPAATTALAPLLAGGAERAKAARGGAAPSRRSSPTPAPSHPASSTPTILLVMGGYAADGTEFGGRDVEAVWVAADGGAVAHARLAARGDCPAPRFHHTVCRFVGSDGKARVVLFGGEGSMVADVGGGGGDDADPTATTTASSPPCAYVLDLATLTWTRINPGPDAGGGGHPGPRALHLACVRSDPATALPQLVVVGGYTGGVLQSMAPWALDLEAREPRWHASRAARAETEAALAAAGARVPPLRASDPAWTPPRRQRAASWPVGSTWLLVAGGSPPAGGFLADVQRLHLPSLAWRAPPALGGRPAGPARIAGHTLAAGLAFGGCLPTLMGVVPVAKLDVLRLVPATVAASAAPGGAAAPGAAPPASAADSLAAADGARFRVWRDTATGRLYAERAHGAGGGGAAAGGSGTDPSTGGTATGTTGSGSGGRAWRGGWGASASPPPAAATAASDDGGGGEWASDAGGGGGEGGDSEGSGWGDEEEEEEGEGAHGGAGRGCVVS